MVGPWGGTLGWENSVRTWSEILEWNRHVCFFNILNYRITRICSLELHCQNYKKFEHEFKISAGVQKQSLADVLQNNFTKYLRTSFLQNTSG